MEEYPKPDERSQNNTPIKKKITSRLMYLIVL